VGSPADSGEGGPTIARKEPDIQQFLWMSGPGYWTVNVTVLVVPFGVTTETFLAVWLAPGPMVKVAVTVVEFTGVTFETVMPVPETFTAVAPVRLVPVSVTVNPAPPRVCALGLIDVNVAPWTVNGWEFEFCPPGVWTITFLVVRAAVFPIVNVAVI